MPATITDTAMVAYVKDAIATAGPEAAPDGATVYLLYLAPGAETVDGSNRQNCGCVALSGAHFRFGGGNAIAFVQRCSPSDVNALTIVASHEIVESVTDPESQGVVETPSNKPWTGTVWAAIQSGYNEVADLCPGTRVHEGEWEYQRSFSNVAAQKGDDPCAPALTEPYYNVTVADEWIPMTPGETTSVTMTGWSTAPRDDWFVYPRLASATQVGFKATVTSDESASTNGAVFYGINNGKTATLHVTAPMAPSGTYAVVRLISRPSSPGNDSLHVWPVGFYIP
jgi:hypothetical protein